MPLLYMAKICIIQQFKVHLLGQNCVSLFCSMMIIKWINFKDCLTKVWTIHNSERMFDNWQMQLVIKLVELIVICCVCIFLCLKMILFPCEWVSQYIDLLHFMDAKCGGLMCITRHKMRIWTVLLHMFWANSEAWFFMHLFPLLHFTDFIHVIAVFWSYCFFRNLGFCHWRHRMYCCFDS